MLLGRCHDGQAIPSYWPWVEILRTYHQSHKLPREGAADIETTLQALLPELGLKGTPSQLAGDKVYNSFLLQDTVIRYLKTAASDTPLPLVLEDIHNADMASLTLLDMLAQSIETDRIGLIATYRSARLFAESRLGESVGELAKLSNYQRIHLAGIGNDDVGELFRTVVGSDVPENAVSAVHRHTDGNCLFVKELVRVLKDEIGVDSPEPSEIDVLIRRHSGSLVPLIAKRLSSLSERSRTILETAALLGREFSFRKLSAVVGSETPKDLHAALEAARRAAFLEFVDHDTGRYSFVHALYQDALTAELGSVTEARRRCAIGLALEEYYQERDDDHAVELAGFLADAETEREKERCYHYSFIAGEQARA